MTEVEREEPIKPKPTAESKPPPTDAQEVLAFAESVLLKTQRNGMPLTRWALEYFDGGTWKDKPDWKKDCATRFIEKAAKHRRATP